MPAAPLLRGRADVIVCLADGAPQNGRPAAPCPARGPSGGTSMTAERVQSRFPGGIPAGVQGPDLEFYRIADRYLDDSLRAYPTTATMVGYHTYDGDLEDLSAGGIEDKL